MKRSRPAGSLVLVAALITSVLVLATSRPVDSSVIVPFGVRFQTNDNGAIRLFGNQLLTCPAAAPNCLNARRGIGQVLNDNNFNMVYVDADGAAVPTINSSRSEVVLPDGSTSLWAGLYWGARLSAGSGGAPAPAAGRTQMKLRPPGAPGYQTITGQVVFGPVGADQAYQRFADITTIVQAAGTGDYWGADVAAGTGEDRYGAWSMAVVFRNPTLPLRNLTVFDGFADVGQNDPATVTISGFLAPDAGPVETQLGMIAYDGDRGSTGDKALMIAPPNPDTLLGSALSAGTNFFNSTYDINGVNITTRTPSDLNMLGFDLKNIGAPGAIPNSATTARLQFTSTGERYFPGVLTTIIDLFSPDFSPSTKTVVNLAGNDPAAPGDQLQYTLNYINAGQDPATNSVTTDPIPAGTSYVPGSLERFVDPDWVPITDGAGDDIGELVPTASPRGSVRFRLGTGATASSGGTIAEGGGTDAVRFQALVEDAAAGSTVINEASLAYVPDTLGGQFTYVPNQTQTPVTTSADLSLTKSTNPDPGLAGATVTSTLTVQNAGPSPAADVVVTDELPDGATFVGASPGCSRVGTVVSCAVGTLAAGGTASVTVSLAIPAGSTAESLTNVAAVNSTTADPNPENNTAGSSVAVARQANLNVSKTVTPATVVPGQTTTYTVTVTNDGPSNALNVTATDTVPDPSLDLTSASASGASCTVTVDVAQCTLPALAPGAALVMTVVGRVSPDAPGGLAIGNTATGTSNTSDPDDADNTATASITTAAPQADIATTKTAGVAVAGGRVTYTVTVTNNGPSAASAVQLADLIPAGLTAVSAESSRGTCTLGAVVTCDLGDLPGPDASGQTTNAVVTITADIPPDFPVGPLTNTATTSTPTADPVPGNDDGTVTSDVTAVADLSVAKTADPVQPVAGENVTFTVTVTNSGPSTARDVVLDDALPAGLTLLSVDPPTCTGAPQLSCPMGDLDPGAAATVTVVMNIPTNFPLDPGAVNTASVTSTTPDPAAGNDTATATVTARPLADVEAFKWDTNEQDPTTPPRTFQAGETVTYFIAAINHGPSSAASVRMIDTLPPGVTFLSVQTPEFCSFVEPNQVICDIPGSYPPNVAIFEPVTVRVDADLPGGTLLTNTLEIGFTDPNRVDPVSSNNFDAHTNPVATSADLNVVKQTYSLDLPSGAMTIPSAAPAGAQTGYLIDVRNDGPSIARDVVVVDSSTMTDFLVNEIRLIRPGLPALDITADCSFSGGDLQCPLGDLPPFAGTDPSWRIQVDGVTLSNAAADSYQNSANLSSSTTEIDPGDNTSTAPITVTAPVATLTIDKTSVGGEDLAGGDGIPEFVPGSTFTYQLTVANVLDPNREGAADADGVVVTDTLPAGFTPTSAVSSQGTCDFTATTVTCNLGTVLGPGRVPEPPPVVITISGTISPDVRGTAANSATVTSPISAPATATHDQGLFALADLAITKVPDATEFAAGATAGFSLVVTNAGPSDALSTSVADLLPPGITFDPEQSDPTCTLMDSPIGPFVDCAIGLLAVGETRTVRVSGRIDPGLAPGELTNTGFVGNISDADPNDADNLSEVPITITQAADIVVSKTADAESVRVGTQVTYILAATNAGPSNAANIVVTDEIPAGLTLVSASPECSEAGGVVTCTTPALEAGLAAIYEIVLEVPERIEAGAVTNTASATSDIADPDPANNQGEATIDVTIEADVAVTKTLLTDPIVAGQPVAYEISLTNNGPNAAPDVTFSDTLAPGTFFLGGTPPDPARGSCSVVLEDGLTIVGCAIDVLAVGETLTGTLTIGTSPDLTGTLANTAYIGSGANDVVLEGAGSQNESTATGDIVAQVDAAVDVVADADVVAAGARASFTVTVSNNGPSTATGVELVNTLPPGLTDPAGPEPRTLPATQALVSPAASLLAIIIQQETCTFVDMEATCALPDLAPGDSVVMGFSAAVPVGTPDGTILTNTAEVTTSGDTVPPNNVDADDVTVRAPIPEPGPTTTTGPTSTTALAGGTGSGSSRSGSGGGDGSMADTGLAVGGLVAFGLGLIVLGGALRRRSLKAR